MADERLTSSPGDLADIERLLQSVAPHANRVNRDRLMFLAGRASIGEAAPPAAGSRTAVRVWQAAASLSTALAIFLAFALLARSRPAPHEAAQTSPDESRPLVSQSAGPETNRPTQGDMPSRLASQASTYFGMRQIALADGVDALPPPSASRVVSPRSDGPQTYGELRRLLLDDRGEDPAPQPGLLNWGSWFRGENL
jgi:hypothetical protein